MVFLKIIQGKFLYLNIIGKGILLLTNWLNIEVYDLAIESIKQGIDKLRINPGNIGSKEKVMELVKEAKKAHIPIRIGVNAGSLKEVHNFSTIKDKAKALVKAAIEHVKILEDCNFGDIAVSLKASDVETTIEAYKLFATKKRIVS